MSQNCGEDDLLLQFKVNLTIFYHADPNAEIAEFYPTGERVAILRKMDSIPQNGLLTEADIINRKHGYNLYLPGDVSEAILYLKNKWGFITNSTDNIGCVLSVVQFYERQMSCSVEIVPSACIKKY